MKQLQIIAFEDEKYFFDERLRELRNVKKPWGRISLNDFEIEHIRTTRTFER